MATHSLASPQHQNANPAPTLPGPASPTTGTPSQMDRYMVLMPTLLPGIRCFVDASTQPDQTTNHVSLAGIGILIVNSQVHPMQTTYIKAAMTSTHSVITAEAAAMALAAMILNRLRLSNVSFLSDCSQLVQFLNDQERHNPPDWRILEYTQVFDNCVSNQQPRIYRIARTDNSTADSLARMALSVASQDTLCTEFTCSYSSHHHQCPLRNALNSVTPRSVRVVAASCC